MTEDIHLPPEVVGTAPGRGRLVGRRVLVVGQTQPSPGPDPPMGNGRAIGVLAARGVEVVCSDLNDAAAEETGGLVRAATGVPAFDSSKTALVGIARQVAREVAYAADCLLSNEDCHISAHSLVLDGGAANFA